MKKVTTIVFVTCLLASMPGYAQEMPAGGVIVNTGCLISDGHTFAEAVEVGRAATNDGENAPNLVFYRQPIAAADAPSNLLLRVVYWDNLEHWVRGSTALANPRGAAAHLNEIMTCNNANRSSK